MRRRQLLWGRWRGGVSIPIVQSEVDALRPAPPANLKNSVVARAALRNHRCPYPAAKHMQHFAGDTSPQHITRIVWRTLLTCTSSYIICQSHRSIDTYEETILWKNCVSVGFASNTAGDGDECAAGIRYLATI